MTDNTKTDFIDGVRIPGDTVSNLELAVDANKTLHVGAVCAGWTYQNTFRFDDLGVLELQERIRLSNFMFSTSFNRDQQLALMPYIIGIPCFAQNAASEQAE